MDGEDSLREVGYTIWENWYDGNGPCRHCPNRDEKGYFNPKNIDPGPESGDSNAEVVFVGMEPSDEIDGTSRKNLSVDEVPESWSRRNRDPGFSNNRDGEDTIREWLFYESDGKKRIDPIFDKKLEGSVYYTNSKKCANTGERDELARCYCHDYLFSQLAAIEPTIIVPFGEKAVKSLSLRYFIPKYSKFSDVVVEVIGETQPHIIPSYHWSRPNFVSNIERAGYESVPDYWVELVDEINAQL
ncbi:uracil-DNA glycosylase family protein [Halanaeroarchaeum sp. HSR-CO]|uniref:uracil-DNA glycosylase family protein n=1 Tax=Halanaeroarchaeum sp. HSR-CO TaxID=2866382 RepID=UPI00217DE92F|nr:uracil-DNA glycosylase family protein [Halanaeroarchaeum sp. HSR-CO]